MPKYRTIDTQSSFIGWGKKGQEVELQVLTFDSTGATTPNGNKVPRVVGTLLKDTVNYKNLSDEKEEVELKAGEQVTVDGSIENLRKALLLANPSRGDFLKMVFTDTYETDYASKGKVIELQHAPGDEGDVGEDDL